MLTSSSSKCLIVFNHRNHLRDSDSLADPAFCELLPKRLLYSFHSTPQYLRTVSSTKEDMPEKFQRVINDEISQARPTPTKTGATKLGGPSNMPLHLLRQIVSLQSRPFHLIVSLMFNRQQSMLNEFHTTMAPSKGSPGGQTALLDSATWANCLSVLKEMTDQLSQAERIRDTPIPIALGIHVQVGERKSAFDNGDSMADHSRTANAGLVLSQYPATARRYAGAVGSSRISSRVSRYKEVKVSHLTNDLQRMDFLRSGLRCCTAFRSFWQRHK